MATNLNYFEKYAKTLIKLNELLKDKFNLVKAYTILPQ